MGTECRKGAPSGDAIAFERGNVARELIAHNSIQARAEQSSSSSSSFLFFRIRFRGGLGFRGMVS